MANGPEGRNQMAAASPAGSTAMRTDRTDDPVTLVMSSGASHPSALDVEAMSRTPGT